MEQPARKKTDDDEIDLYSIGNRLSVIFSYPFKLILSNVLLTILFIIAGIAVAITLKYTIPKTYKASFIIRPNDKTERFHLKLLADLQFLLKQKDYEALARELNIERSVIETLGGMELTNPYIKNRTDSVNSTEIALLSSGYSQFIPVQTSILNYLENNPYFAKIRDVQKEQIEIGLELIDKDLARLDSLKILQLANYENQKTGGGNMILMNELINPTATYAMGIERLNKKIALLTQKKYIDNFQLVKGCVVTRRHHSPPRILVMCLYIVPLFLLAGLVFFHVRRQNRTDKTMHAGTHPATDH